MKNKKLGILGILVVIIMAFLVLFVACRDSQQSVMSIPVPLTFEGEYSYDQTEWLPLEEKTELSVMNKDLFLRGNFDFELPEGIPVNFYQDHISMSLAVNGQIVFLTSDMEADTGADLCGKIWNEWISSGIGKDDLVEIHLHNSHNYGRRDAYREFLKSIYTGNQSFFKDWLGSYTRPFWAVWIFVLVFALALAGLGIGFILFHIPQGGFLLNLGFFSLFMTGYAFLDITDISLRNNLIIFNTYGCILCLMIAALELSICVCNNLSGTFLKAAQTGTVVLGLWTVTVLVPVLMKKIILYDILPFWFIGTAAVSACLFVCCVGQIRRDKKVSSTVIFLGIMLMAVIAEILNFFTGWWKNGLFLKSFFLLFFIFHLVKIAVTIPISYQNSIKAKRLEGELKNNRVVLAMSQIRTHFIFNVLNAISGMCKYDPEKADETVVRFARYLRNNIDILEEDKLVSFEKALEHLEDFVILEQVRFEDKIRFTEHLEVKDFRLPSLILQPVVENSIKHGLLPKEEGGTIELCTRQEGSNILITITDDGVGYDTHTDGDKGSVGLENVKFRLKYMVKGRLDLESRSGEGTKVTITIPCDQIKEKE